MRIAFINAKLEAIANEDPDAPKSILRKLIKKSKAGCEPEDIIATLDALAAAPSCADIPPFFHPHPLQGELKGFFAIDLQARGRGRHRILFKPDHGNDQAFRIDNYKTITRIIITDLCADYHD